MRKKVGALCRLFGHRWSASTWGKVGQECKRCGEPFNNQTTNGNMPATDRQRPGHGTETEPRYHEGMTYEDIIDLLTRAGHDVNPSTRRLIIRGPRGDVVVELRARSEPP